MRMGLQARKVYKFLLEEGVPKTAGEIALRLGIAAADVYRLVKPLISAGMIEKTVKRPVKFLAKETEAGLGLFLLTESGWFNNQFGSIGKQKSKDHEEMDWEFVQGRDELMDKSTTEIDRSTQSVDLLRSGHEMPAEVLRALVQAIQRNVKVRMIIQDYDGENREQVENWIKNGIWVKKTKLKHLRLMLYDSKVSYFMSYKHPDSGQDMGMKIVYSPFSAILSRYFDELWKKAEKIVVGIYKIF